MVARRTYELRIAERKIFLWTIKESQPLMSFVHKFQFVFSALLSTKTENASKSNSVPYV